MRHEAVQAHEQPQTRHVGGLRHAHAGRGQSHGAGVSRRDVLQAGGEGIHRGQGVLAGLRQGAEGVRERGEGAGAAGWCVGYEVRADGGGAS